jgi:hypothetical protein
MDLSSFLKSINHAAQHILGGSQEIDGDQIEIAFTPSNYTPSTTPAEVSDTDHLSAHLAGIDDELTGGSSGISEDYFEDIKRKQTIAVKWQAANKFYLLPGVCCVDNGSNVLPLYTDSVISYTTDTLSADTIYYVYLDPPASGYVLSVDDIELSTTAPTKSDSKQGFYHGTNTDWRCIFALVTDGDGDIVKFYQFKDEVVYDVQFTDDHSDSTPRDEWTDQLLTVPLFGDEDTYALIYVYLQTTQTGSSNYGQIRRKAWLGEITLGWVSAYWQSAQNTRMRQACDGSGYCQTKTSVDTDDNVCEIQTHGWVIPYWVYNG